MTYHRPISTHRMPRFCLHESQFAFPPVSEADEDGLLLIGGKPTPTRVLQAYRKGIFPWYDDDNLPLWYSPDPRFILFPKELHISRSMNKVLSKGVFAFKTDTAFEDVIAQCAAVSRKGQNGTWITDEMKNVYTALHRQGWAHSAETWKDGSLVGGMYGLRIGNVFFGESMFSTESNASKFAFIRHVQQLQAEGMALMDCQAHTPHVESMGGRMISRNDYLKLLSPIA